MCLSFGGPLILGPGMRNKCVSLFFSGPKNDAKSGITYATVRSRAVFSRQKPEIVHATVRFERCSNLREVGATLPEDTSREGCGVRVPDPRRAGTR